MRPLLFTIPIYLLAAGVASAGAGAKAPSSHAVHRPASAARTVQARATYPPALVAAANAAALVEPAASGYVNAAQVYPFEPGRVYRLYASPGAVSDIALQPGERLVSVAAGDTLRWVIGNTASGSGASKQTHILVKPGSLGLETNLVIATDRRVYLVEVESVRGPAMVAISWSYPADALLALTGTEAAAPTETPIASGLDVQTLDFGYAIEGGRPPWRPIRAFDDGHHVFIEFPPSFGTVEAPPLFVIGSSGKAELVNYRVLGRYYVVDQLFSAAELRLGEKHQEVVRIVRSGHRDHDGFSS